MDEIDGYDPPLTFTPHVWVKVEGLSHPEYCEFCAATRVPEREHEPCQTRIPGPIPKGWIDPQKLGHDWAGIKPSEFCKWCKVHKGRETEGRVCKNKLDPAEPSEYWADARPKRVSGPYGSSRVE